MYRSGALPAAVIAAAPIHQDRAKQDPCCKNDAQRSDNAGMEAQQLFISALAISVVPTWWTLVVASIPSPIDLVLALRSIGALSLISI